MVFVVVLGHNSLIEVLAREREDGRREISARVVSSFGVFCAEQDSEEQARGALRSGLLEGLPRPRTPKQSLGRLSGEFGKAAASRARVDEVPKGHSRDRVERKRIKST